MVTDKQAGVGSRMFNIKADRVKMEMSNSVDMLKCIEKYTSEY